MAGSNTSLWHVHKALKIQHTRDWYVQSWSMAVQFRTPQSILLQDELERVKKRAARFVTGNFTCETASMTGILEQLKWESLRKRRKDIRLIMLYKRVQPVYPQMTLFPQLGVPGIITPWHFKPHWLRLILTSQVSFPDYKRLELPNLCF